MILMMKYNQIMEKIHVTPEMLSRLQNGIDACLNHQKRVRRYKIAGIVAACLVLAVSGTTMIHRSGIAWGQGEPKPPIVAVGGVQEYASITQLAESLSFPLSVPAVLPDGYAFESAANQFGMAVVIYSDGEQQIKYCMGEGDDALIGNHHTDSGHQIDANHAVLYDDTNRGYTIAEWQDDTYSYCIISDIPLSEELWSEMIESVAPVDGATSD